MRISLSVLLLFVAGTIAAQGIRFNPPGNWQAQLKLASKQDRLLFVDVYTNWCSPCKEMDRTVFSTQNVGDVYNNGFINIKLDAESGPGPELAKKYGVSSYPTYLFINGKGELIYRASGMFTRSEMIKKAKLAVAEKNNGKPIGEWLKAYPKQKHDTAFMKGYLQKRARLEMESSKEYDEYLRLLPSGARVSPQTIQLILDNTATLPLSSETFLLLWKNYSRIAADTQFTRPLNEQLEMSIRIAAHLMVKKGDTADLRKFLALNSTAPAAAQLPDNLNYEELFYRSNKMKEPYLALVIPQLEKLAAATSNDTTQLFRNELAQDLNNAARFLADHFEDAATLKHGLFLIEKAIALKPDRFPTDFIIWNTYAHVLYKKGDTGKAIGCAQKALDMVSGDNKKYGFTEQLEADLERMKKNAANGKP
ncbi:thioredoxin family protein [Sediminibacterium ginsengisoli]|uniref:Thioredoxin-related protein n=1 Tax=Sediminibacterium ginsengisoli TaxID=413434 RepID=A0A1T4R428_9BACT|nr:thioredoxin fold domain-containing protein [Sediminibacterium ginsengisoli]SKA10401.1 Thioredoxin-related protein [Sediminibacterium ginsengisoli]